MLVRGASGTARTVKRIRVRDASNVLKEVKSGRIRTTSGIGTFFSSFKVIVDPKSVEGSASSSKSVTIITDGVYTTVMGGSEPFTYSWTTAAAGWSATSPTAAGTYFKATSVADGETKTATFTVTVTDSGGNVVTDTATGTVTNYGTGSTL